MIKPRESVFIDRIPFHAWEVQIRAQQMIETAKGCEATIWPQQVALEPPYTPMHIRPRLEDPKQILAAYENGLCTEDFRWKQPGYDDDCIPILSFIFYMEGSLEGVPEQPYSLVSDSMQVESSRGSPRESPSENYSLWLAGGTASFL